MFVIVDKYLLEFIKERKFVKWKKIEVNKLIFFILRDIYVGFSKSV